MQSNHELTSSYIALLDQIRYLLSRENLCNNTYLYKQMKTNLSLPLYLIAEERKIAAITNNQQQIINALQESAMARVVNGREVFIIEYPTVKISTKNPQIFREIERVLKEKDLKYSFSERSQKQFINLTLYSQSLEFLQQLLASLSRQIDYQRASLYQDIRAGTARIKKMKQEHKNNNNFLGKTKYSLDKPPQIFIRRSVPSEDQEDEERQKGRYGSDRKKKYKEVTKEEVAKPKFNSEDFPSLS